MKRLWPAVRTGDLWMIWIGRCDAWSRELGERRRAEDLTGRAHQVHDEEAVEEAALAVAEVVEEGFPVAAAVDHASRVGKAGAKARGGRVGERSRVRTQGRGR